MATTINPLPATGKTITVTTGSNVLVYGPNAASPLVNTPSNGKTWIFQNLDSNNFLFLQFSLTTIGSNLTATDSIRVNPNTALTIEVGPEGYRMDPNQNTFYLYARADSGNVSMNVVQVMASGFLRGFGS
jgi:hypothetical protein